MPLSLTFYKQVSADCEMLNKKLDWSAITKKWVGPLLAYWLAFAAYKGEASVANSQ
jgi:hypothetical protein